jgi:hypothetical protein
VAANALALARHGVPKEPFYLTGQVGGRPFSVHAEGERVIMTGTEGRKEVELTPPPRPVESGLPVPVCPSPVIAPTSDDMIDASPAPGTSPLDDARWLTHEGG